MTGYLQAVIEKGQAYAAVAPLLADLVRGAPGERVVDLASGGGGPWLSLLDRLAEEGVTPQVTLTDIEPNRTAATRLGGHPQIRYREDGVSALEVPKDLEGVRTLFTALHHFSPQQVRDILCAAQRDRVPFLAAEATHRSVRGLLVTLLIPLFVLGLMPTVTPRRTLPLLLTYFPPILPLVIWWDGFASTLRTYRAEELRAITADASAPDYEWSVQEVAVRGAPIPLTVVVGRPLPPAGPTLP